MEPKIQPLRVKFNFHENGFHVKSEWKNNSALCMPQCGNVCNFLPLKFYVKSNSAILKTQKMPFYQFQEL